jgi:glucose-1-phosphatase
VDISEKQIKNIIFDLGGVILNIDYNLLVAAFSMIGLPHFEAYFSQKEQRALFDEYEKGLISSGTFREQLKAQCRPGTTDSEINDAWNSMLLDLPEQRLDLLINVKTKYRIFLLSNTNEIHMQFIYEYLRKTFHINDFSGCFEKVYLSYEMQMRKPDDEIFQKILSEKMLNAAETLFIDDSVQHIETARRLGIQTRLLDVKKESINDFFNPHTFQYQF